MARECQVTDLKFHVESENVGKFLYHMMKQPLDFHFDIDGNITSFEYLSAYECRSWNFLNKAAQYVKNGSYIEFVGEEGERWKFLFENGSMRTVYARLVWD